MYVYIILIIITMLNGQLYFEDEMIHYQRTYQSITYFAVYTFIMLLYCALGLSLKSLFLSINQIGGGGGRF